MTAITLVVDNTAFDAPPEDSPYQEYLRWERRRLRIRIAAGFTLSTAVLIALLTLVH